jgi:cation diffusion facilitator CzcD-associated flavoprotein CzcO
MSLNEDSSVVLAVVGAGPAGLSAAACAAKMGVPHVLLEAAEHPADTLFKYQKGKHVMSTPVVLPLRSALPFDSGAREDALAAWGDGILGLGVNIRHRSEVVSITGEQGNFTLLCYNGDRYRAEHVVLAIGMQGNLRKLEVPGADRFPALQY